jgi:hypothetical protein
MLASTVQFSRCGRSRSRFPPPAADPPKRSARYDAQTVLPCRSADRSKPAGAFPG